MATTPLEKQAYDSVVSKPKSTAFIVTVAAMHKKCPAQPSTKDVNKYYHRVMRKLPTQVRVCLENVVGTVWKNKLTRSIVIGVCVLIIIGWTSFNVVGPWYACAEQYRKAVSLGIPVPVAPPVLVDSAAGGANWVQQQFLRLFWTFYCSNPSVYAFDKASVAVRSYVASNRAMLYNKFSTTHLAHGIKAVGWIFESVGATIFDVGFHAMNQASAVDLGKLSVGLLVSSAGDAMKQLGDQVISLQNKWVWLFVHVSALQRLLPGDNEVLRELKTVDIRKAIELKISEATRTVAKKIKERAAATHDAMETTRPYSMRAEPSKSRPPQQAWWSRMMFGDKNIKRDQSRHEYESYMIDRRQYETEESVAAARVAQLLAKQRRSFLTRKESRELKSLQLRSSGSVRQYSSNVEDYKSQRASRPLSDEERDYVARLYDAVQRHGSAAQRHWANRHQHLEQLARQIREHGPRLAAAWWHNKLRAIERDNLMGGDARQFYSQAYNHQYSEVDIPPQSLGIRRILEDVFPTKAKPEPSGAPR
jgi:hypothetical protein